MGERRGLLKGSRMSQVQVAGLEILMILEQIKASKIENQQFRLSLMDRDPDKVKTWFPEWFSSETVTVASEEEADRLVSFELGGGASVWESGPTPAITPEDLEALIANLSSGTGSLVTNDDVGTAWV